MPATDGFARAARPGFILVVGEPVVGFAHVLETDGQAHLEQLSVLRSRQRRGLGSALLRAAMAEVARRGRRVLMVAPLRG